jgi:hypothetical protein
VNRGEQALKEKKKISSSSILLAGFHRVSCLLFTQEIDLCTAGGTGAARYSHRIEEWLDVLPRDAKMTMRQNTHNEYPVTQTIIRPGQLWRRCSRVVPFGDDIACYFAMEPA